MTPDDISSLADNDELLEVGRRAVEGAAIDFRNHRIQEIRGNGICVKERDGKLSAVIRFGPETALRVALKAIAKQMARREMRGGVDRLAYRAAAAMARQTNGDAR